MALRSEAAGPRQPARRPAHRWRWASAAALLVTVAAGTLLASLYHRPSGTQAVFQSHAAVRVIGSASYERTRTGGDEIIRLEAGTIDLEVRPLAAAERLRVVVGDAAVEVRGTHFDVTASEGRLQAVRVFHGAVDVAVGERQVARLGEGDQWMASPPAPLPARAIADAVVGNGAPVKSAIAADESGTATSGLSAHSTSRTAGPRRPVLALASHTAATAIQPADHAAFEQGWALLRQGDFMDAAAAFADLERHAPGDAIVEDALFWRGVALARAGQKVQARAAVASFVGRFPQSARAGEASASLGWLLLEDGDRVGARTLFERAARDRSERVRSSARSGLQQIEATEKNPVEAESPPAATR